MDLDLHRPLRRTELGIAVGLGGGGCSSLPISSAMSKKPEKVSDSPPRSAVAARKAVILSRSVSE